MIKKIIRERFYFIWKVLKINMFNKYIYNDKIESSKKNIYIMLAADYPNFGDIAITYAQKLFLQDVFPNANIIEIPCNDTFNYIKYIKKNLKNDDIITLTGGGNVGNKYPYYEELRLTIIKYFSKNKIVSFPQTIDFSNDKSGVCAMKKSMKTYKKCQNLLFLVREKKSYDIAKKYLHSSVQLYPDIALYLKNKNKYLNKKNGKIGLCFRNDGEIDLNSKKEIQDIKLKKDKNSFTFDTVMDYNLFDYSARYDDLENMLKKISKLDTVYTNRLHAMIFCYITNTNCLFIDNSNKKISGVYNEWLSDSKIINEYDTDKKVGLVKNNQLDEYFNKLKKTLELEMIGDGQN